MAGPQRQRLGPRTADGPWPEEAAATPLLDALRARFGARILAVHAFRGDETAFVGRDDLIEIVRWLRDEPRVSMEFLMDLTVVDLKDLNERPRFEVVYHFFSRTHLHRLRIKVRVEEAPAECRVPSLTPLYRSADWMEREAWEFYGVVFDGHPDLRHILLYPEFQGFPLRKDYPKQGEQPRLQLQEHRSWPRPRPADIR